MNSERVAKTEFSNPACPIKIEIDRRDLSILKNPDARAWAAEFMKTWEKLGKPEPDQEWMLA